MHLPRDDDGTAVIPRLCLVDAFVRDDGLRCVLDRAVFLAAGDRVRFRGSAVEIQQRDGRVRHPAADVHWWCGLRL